MYSFRAKMVLDIYDDISRRDPEKVLQVYNKIVENNAAIVQSLPNDTYEEKLKIVAAGIGSPFENYAKAHFLEWLMERNPDFPEHLKEMAVASAIPEGWEGLKGVWVDKIFSDCEETVTVH